MAGQAENSEKRDTAPKDENTDVMKQIMGFEVRQTWVSPTTSLTSCVTLGHILNPSEPVFPFLKWEQYLLCVVVVQVKSDHVREGQCLANKMSSARRLRTGRLG